MNRFFDKYLKQLSLMIFIIIVMVVSWNLIFPMYQAAPWWPFYLTFFFLVTVIVHYALLNSLKGKPGRFIGMFMAMTLGKLIIYMVTLVLNVIYSPFNKPSVIVPFLTFYLFFTFFEMKQLSTVVRQKSDTKNKNS